MIFPETETRVFRCGAILVYAGVQWHWRLPDFASVVTLQPDIFIFCAQIHPGTEGRAPCGGDDDVAAVATVASAPVRAAPLAQ